MFELFFGNKKRPYRIVYNGHPALRRKALPVTEVTPEIREMAERLILTLKTSEVPGVGLAAPQVGESLRMVAIDTRSRKEGKGKQKALSEGEALLNPRMPLVLVNPEIISSSAEKNIASEGCLSLPGVEGDVKRSVRVTLRAKDIDGHEIIAECGGLLARCLQHELDHLDGILFIDRASERDQAAASEQMYRLSVQEAALEQASQRGIHE